jgi:hypothetical protein
MELPTLVPVEYRGGLAALVSADRVHIVAPWLLVRPAGDPELRFLAFMCLCAGQVLRGAIEGPFSSRLAEDWARRALIDEDRLAAMGEVSDAEAATRLDALATMLALEPGRVPPGVALETLPITLGVAPELSREI